MKSLFQILVWAILLALIAGLIIFFAPVILLVMLLQLLFGWHVFSFNSLRNVSNPFRKHRSWYGSPAENEPQRPDVPASEDVIDAVAVDLPEDRKP